MIDTHCHLNNPVFQDSLTLVIERAKAVGVTGLVVPAYDLESLSRTASLAQLYAEIHPAFGIHPMYLGDPIPLDLLAALCQQHRAVAIGEIGLDFMPGRASPEIQEYALREQLDLAISLNLPVILHCRKAVEAIYRILRKYAGRIHGVMHSFPGTSDWARKFVDLGFYISFAGSVTRTKARKYCLTAQQVPMAKILLETDAPCISTQRVRADKVEPCHLPEVAQAIAKCKQLDLSLVMQQSTENATALFGHLVAGQ